MKTISLFILLFCATFANAQQWYTNFDQAKSAAKEQNKNILMVFSGSDWCAPCIKLDREIWQSQQFKKAAKENWILVKADFPKSRKNKLSKEQLKHNEQLASKYNTRGYFPMVVVLSADEKVLGKTGYKKLTPEKYISLLKSFK